MNANQIDLSNFPRKTEELSECNTFPNSENRVSKLPIITKKINSETEGLSPTKVSGLGSLRQTVWESNKKYQINWFSPKADPFQESEGFSVLFEVPEVCSVEDFILMGVKELNKILELKQTGYCLAETSRLYELFIAKKNGKPKEDYPAYDYELLVSATKNHNFVLIPKNNSDFLITKKEQKYKPFLLENSPKKTVKFLEKEEKKKHLKEIIVLPDEEDENYDNSGFLKIFCFCWSKSPGKRKLLKGKH